MAISEHLDWCASICAVSHARSAAQSTSPQLLLRM
jgi:hypothetical protein